MSQPNSSLPGTAVRRHLVLALVLSIGLHLLAGASTIFGWLNLMPWFGKPEEPAPVVLNARLAPLPPPPAATPAAIPVSKPRVPRPRGTSTPLPVVAAAGPATVPPPPPAPAPDAPKTEPVPVASEPPVPPREETPPKRMKSSPLPERARIEFEMTLEANNYKVWAAQTWEGRDGRYRVLLTAEARALFFSLGKLTMESAGVITADGLRPERYVDERNQRRTAVSFAANEKSAYVEEPNGNKKTVQLAGQAADVMSLTYDLAFNPDISIGAPFSLSNRDTAEEIRLHEKRDETLSTDNMTLATRFYDFRRPNGTGGIQVWLAVDRQWLPAKLRILGRDGAVSLVATKFEINPAP